MLVETGGVAVVVAGFVAFGRVVIVVVVLEVVVLEVGIEDVTVIALAVVLVVGAGEEVVAMVPAANKAGF